MTIPTITYTTTGRFEILNVTSAYRVRITWADGRETLIGDYPTRRLAAQEAERWMEQEESKS